MLEAYFITVTMWKLFQTHDQRSNRGLIGVPCPNASQSPNAIQQVFNDHVILIQAKTFEEAVSQIDDLCGIFKNNIIDGANTLYKDYKEYLRDHFFSRDYVGTWTEDSINNLQEDSDLMLNKIKRDNMWIRKHIETDIIENI